MRTFRTEGSEVKWFREKRAIHPLFTRMGNHFVLADFMYNDSVVRKGDVNYLHELKGSIDSNVREHIEQMSDYMHVLTEGLGQCSISYGFISPAHSEQRVKWRNPTLPSYHRWDEGAAADVVFHRLRDTDPILRAHQIMQTTAFSRLITYSESEYTCVATGLDDHASRSAAYYNVYQGQPGAKPLYLNLSKRDVERIAMYKEPSSKCETAYEYMAQHGWRGAGYPTYHGGGRRQTQHIRLGQYIMMIDLLRNPANIHVNWADYPLKHCRPPHDEEAKFLFKNRAGYIDQVWQRAYWSVPSMDRISILSAYKGLAAPFKNRIFKGIPDQFEWDDKIEMIVSVNSAVQAEHLRGHWSEWADGMGVNSQIQTAEDVGASHLLYLRADY